LFDSELGDAVAALPEIDDPQRYGLADTDVARIGEHQKKVLSHGSRLG